MLLPLHRKTKEVVTSEKWLKNGALVQLVRIHACHAWGHGFESRTHRKKPRKFRGFFVLCLLMMGGALPAVDVAYVPNYL